MNNDYPIGFIALMPETEVCHCGDGTPHHHPYQVMWDGKTWLRQGTQEFDALTERLGAPARIQ